MQCARLSSRDTRRKGSRSEKEGSRRKGGRRDVRAARARREREDASLGVCLRACFSCGGVSASEMYLLDLRCGGGDGHGGGRVEDEGEHGRDKCRPTRRTRCKEMSGDDERGCGVMRATRVCDVERTHMQRCEVVRLRPTRLNAPKPKTAQSRMCRMQPECRLVPLDHHHTPHTYIYNTGCCTLRLVSCSSSSGAVRSQRVAGDVHTAATADVVSCSLHGVVRLDPSSSFPPHGGVRLGRRAAGAVVHLRR